MLSESSLLLQEYDEKSKLIGNSTDAINTKIKVKCEFTVVSQLGMHLWVLKHNSRFWPAWMLGSISSGPLKCGTWVWALAQDTTVFSQ